jgi:hypothetical protein
MMFFPQGSSVAIKLEFKTNINDRSYFYLIGTIMLTETEIIELCNHFEKCDIEDASLTSPK